MTVQTVLFDVCGVIADARGRVPWKIKVAMEEACLAETYGIGFMELMLAYCSGGFSGLWKKYKVEDKDRNHYHQIYDMIPEYPPGSMSVYPEVPFVLNELRNNGIVIGFLTRLTTENVRTILREIQRRRFEGDIDNDIKLFNPRNDEVRKNDDRFVAEVMHEAIEGTDPRRVYVDDSIDRSAHLKRWDPELVAIGCTRGFYSEKEMRRVYYKLTDDGFEYSTYQKKGYKRLFDVVLSTLEDLPEKILAIGR